MMDFFCEWVLPIFGTIFLFMVFVTVIVMFYCLVSQGGVTC